MACRSVFSKIPYTSCIITAVKVPHYLVTEMADKAFHAGDYHLTSISSRALTLRGTMRDKGAEVELSCVCHRRIRYHTYALLSA